MLTVPSCSCSNSHESHCGWQFIRPFSECECNWSWADNCSHKHPGFWACSGCKACLYASLEHDGWCMRTGIEFGSFLN